MLGAIRELLASLKDDIGSLLAYEASVLCRFHCELFVHSALVLNMVGTDVLGGDAGRG